MTPQNGGSSSWQPRKRAQEARRRKPKVAGANQAPAPNHQIVDVRHRLVHSFTLIEKARQMGMKKLAVLISSGKDSVLLADIVMRSGVPASFFTKYIVKDLDIDEEVLLALEQKYGIIIERLPSPRRLAMFESDTLCINRIFEAQSARQNAHSAKFDEMIKIKADTPWVATGIRITDGPQRALSLTKHPNPHPVNKKVYPIAEWRKGEVWSHIKKQGLPISRAYNLIGRSLDCLNVAHVYPLKFGSPKDYERIVADFPLMECLCWIYERRVERYGLASIGEC